ncbi:hypothetical protein AVEN_115599-1 [Araneus ventricosus]|uniref:Uncharacterized protein n=1 Tax=Araneus ventricosus TaxID=182803 RepID=A0A4Y2VZ39_ARAVE|nr:hypothetical protein AVEN_115599-1 [Araneus ventricosus]
MFGTDCKPAPAPRGISIIQVKYLGWPSALFFLNGAIDEWIEFPTIRQGQCPTELMSHHVKEHLLQKF